MVTEHHSTVGCCRLSIVREAVCVCVYGMGMQGIFRDSLDFPLNFAMNLKLL